MPAARSARARRSGRLALGALLACVCAGCAYDPFGVARGRSSSDAGGDDGSSADGGFSSDAGSAADAGGCVPETDAALCTRLGKQCGPVADAPDNCGARRSVDCGGCGVGTCTSNRCVCSAESVAELCAIIEKNCGLHTTTDRCAQARALDCGTCDGVCTAGVCCAAKTDAQLCAALGKNCGRLTTTHCGQARTVECGACSGTCTSNVCSCSAESDAQLCAAGGHQCGSVSLTDRCGATRARNCGSCGAGSCVANTCSCGPAQWAVETLDSGGDFGAFSSVFVRDSSLAAAWSRDDTNPIQLRVGTRPVGSGTWTRTTVPPGTRAELGDSALVAQDAASLRVITVANRTELLELVRPVAGTTWTPNIVAGGKDYYARDFVIQPDGVRHLAWLQQDENGSELVYARAAASGGTWSRWTEEVHVNDEIDLDFDGTGKAHLVTSRGSYTAQEVWYSAPGSSSALVSSMVGDGDNSGIAVSGSTVHVLYTDRYKDRAVCPKPCATKLWHATRPTGGGTWTRSSPVTIPSHPEGRRVRVAAGPASTLHALYYDAAAQKVMYAVLRNGSWRTALVANVSVGAYSLAVDASGGVHALLRDQTSGNILYAYKCPEG